MKILVFVSDYPSKHRNNFVFVKQLVNKFAELGNECYVISPNPILRNRSVEKVITSTKYKNEGKVLVFRENYLTIPFLKIGSFIPSEWLRMRAINDCIRKLGVKPDVIYCHFWNQGLIGYEYAKKWGIPLFVASGESEIAGLTDLKKVTPAFCDYVKGVICVSTKCKDESIKLGLTKGGKCSVIPNAIDSTKFYQLDKQECREKLCVPKGAFVVCFVGWFIERKGPRRVTEAIDKIGDKNIYSFFLGKGPQQVNSSHILFSGSVSHDELIYFLNASDIFVLPTLNEGCCNAVIEAMACGLPIVSSNLPFNWDVLNASNSIMVNPENVDEISKAIKVLYEDKQLRMKLSEGALATAKQLNIKERALKIIDFMNQKAKI